MSNESEQRDGELTGIHERWRFDELPGAAHYTERQRWQSFRERYHAAQQCDAPSAFPLQVDFELNSTCQLRCAFCVHGQQRVPKKLLPIEVFKRAIDECEQWELCSTKLNYINEPLLRRDLPEFVRYARQHGVLNVYFATNGLLLQGDIVRELIEAGLSKVMVSIDAATAETYARMRRSTDFDRVERNIHALLELRNKLGITYPMVRVNFLRTRENQHEEEAFIRRWSGVADALGFQQQVQMPGIDDDLLPARQTAERFRCSFPSKLLVVDADADILPCCTFSGRAMPLANLQTSSLREAWQSSQRRELQELHQLGRGSEVPVCAHCIGGSSGQETVRISKTEKPAAEMAVKPKRR